VLSTAALLLAAGSLGACWLLLASGALAARYVHDRALRLRESDAEALCCGSLGPGDLSRRRLRRIALGPSTPAAAVAAPALAQAELPALLQRAANGRKRSVRLRALTILVRAGSPYAIDLLRAALAADDRSLAASAVRLTSELDTRAADVLLLDVLVEGRHPRSRTATELEPRAARLRPRLVELASHTDAGLRFWAVTLLGGDALDPSTESAVAFHAGDVDPGVRAAAAEALGKFSRALSQPTLRRLLEDDVFFVRAHAARGVGDAKLIELAGDVVPLLADTNWWVRASAKESLLALGADGFRAALVALEHPDRFARDGALEIVVASKHLHDLLAAAEAGDAEARALATTIEERRPGTIDRPERLAA
jgi:HEAT repeat protein